MKIYGFVSITKSYLNVSDTERQRKHPIFSLLNIERAPQKRAPEKPERPPPATDVTEAAKKTWLPTPQSTGDIY